MTWILCAVGAIVLLIVLALIFDMSPALIVKSIFQNLILMFIVIGLGNLIGYFVGSQQGGFVVGCIVCLLVDIKGIVDREWEDVGSTDDYFSGKMRKTKDTRVDGWIGIMMLAALAVSFILGTMSGN